MKVLKYILTDEVDLLIKSIDYKSYEEEFYIKGFNAADDETGKSKILRCGTHSWLCWNLY